MILAAILLATTLSILPPDVAQAQLEYEQRQARLRCDNHPDTCARPLTENEKALHEFRQRQRRLKHEPHRSSVD